MVYYIIAILLFATMGYIIHKLAYDRFEKINGRKPTRKELFSIYHWEVVLGISAAIVLTFVYVLKSSNVLPF